MTMLTSLKLRGSIDTANLSWTTLTALRSLTLATFNLKCSVLPPNLRNLTLYAPSTFNEEAFMSSASTLQTLTLRGTNLWQRAHPLVLQPSITTLVCNDRVVKKKSIIADHVRNLKIMALKNVKRIRDYTYMKTMTFLSLSVYTKKLYKIMVLLDGLLIPPSVLRVRIKSPGYSIGHEICFYKNWEKNHPRTELVILFDNIEKYENDVCPYCQ
jgi:hypothetical protein